MSTALLPTSIRPIDCPESDGEPMADNTKQWRWMVVLFGNLAALFRDAADVLVGGNLIWYPVEGQPETKAAPLAMPGRAGGLPLTPRPRAARDVLSASS
jgi:hypothetical protein